MRSPYRRCATTTPGRVRFAPQYGGVTTAAQERVPIARLRAGSPIEGVFACTRKDRMTARTGTAYLAVDLAGQFERGDLVRVSGRVERFRDELTAELSSIARADSGDADPSEFLPA